MQRPIRPRSAGWLKPRKAGVPNRPRPAAMSSTASGSSRTPRRTRITPVAAAPIPVCSSSATATIISVGCPLVANRAASPLISASWRVRRSSSAVPPFPAGRGGTAARTSRPASRWPSSSATLCSSAYISSSQVPSWSAAAAVSTAVAPPSRGCRAPRGPLPRRRLARRRCRLRPPSAVRWRGSRRPGRRRCRP